MIVIPFYKEEVFGNLAGEDHKEDIQSTFYDRDDFQEFYNPYKKLSIVSARKGMGKSALLSFLEYKLHNESEYNSPLVINVTGTDLQGLGDFSQKDHIYLENYWKKIICKKIIIALGAQVGFAFSSNEISMVELAELEGFKEKNLVGGLLSRIKGKIPAASIEVQNSIPDNYGAILDNYLEKNTNQIIWLLVDDIDAKFLNNEEFQARVGSFFSAIRALSNDFSNLRIRATVRSDVWSCLRHLEDLDKIDQYMFEIVWIQRNMRLILAKKILSYIQKNFPNSPEAKNNKIERDYNKLIEHVFDSPINWNDSGSAHVFEAINAFSNRRPRWMLQLCIMAGKKAKEESGLNKRIKLKHINYILQEYGKRRRDDLIKEHKHQFSEIELLIDSLRATEKEFNYQDIVEVIQENYIRGRSNEQIPKVDGAHYAHCEDLGNFLYKIGLISRIHDDRIKFTHFVDDPDLFKSAKNRENALNWSIHPAYRDFLNIR